MWVVLRTNLTAGHLIDSLRITSAGKVYRVSLSQYRYLYRYCAAVVVRLRSARQTSAQIRVFQSDSGDEERQLKAPGCTCCLIVCVCVSSTTWRFCSSLLVNLYTVLVVRHHLFPAVHLDRIQYTIPLSESSSLPAIWFILKQNWLISYWESSRMHFDFILLSCVFTQMPHKWFSENVADLMVGNIREVHRMWNAQ